MKLNDVNKDLEVFKCPTVLPWTLFHVNNSHHLVSSISSGHVSNVIIPRAISSSIMFCYFVIYVIYVNAVNLFEQMIAEAFAFLFLIIKILSLNLISKLVGDTIISKRFVR